MQKNLHNSHTKTVAIVGCGPAGLSTAIALHDIGLQVCLFEQFDEPKPVGSGLMLQPTGLSILKRWDLLDEIESLGQRIDGMLGRVAPDDKVVLDISYNALGKAGSESVYGVAIHRASLFHVLYNAVLARGIPIQTNARVHNVNHATIDNTSTVQLTDEHGNAIGEPVNLVVDASGSRSNLARNIGAIEQVRDLDYGALWTTVEMDSTSFKPTLLEQRYKNASTMVGVLPCGRLPNSSTQLATFFWSIRKDQYESFLANGLSAWKDAVSENWPATRSLLDDVTDTHQLTYARYSHHTIKTPYRAGVVFVGDAAHATSPQLGQGVNMAMLDALALSSAIARHPKQSEFAPLYARMRSTHVKLFQAASTLLTPFYQSDSRFLPAIRDTLFEPVSVLPFAKKLVASLGAGLVTQPIKRIDKLS